MDNIRLVLYLALAYVLFLMWQAWQEDYGPQPQAAASATADPASADALPEPPADLPPAPAADPAPAALGDEHAPKGGSTIQVRTDLLEAVIATNGASLHELRLLTYPVDLERPADPVRLLRNEPPRVFVADSGLLSARAQATHHVSFTAEQQAYHMAPEADDLSVPLFWTSPEGIRVTKTYTFHRDSYLVDVSFRVDNPESGEPWTGRAYGQFLRTPPGEDESSAFIYTYTGAVFHSEEFRYDKVDFDDMRGEPFSRDMHGGWVAMIQHYFGAAWIPPADAANHYYTKALPGARFVAGVVGPTLDVPPGTSGELHLRLYAGPKEQERLAAAAPGLQLTVDYGYLTLIADPLYWLLEIIHDAVGNWGWAIVVLTLLIKLAFYRLSAASYRSMARMKKLTPKLQALKERYGDDKQRLNQAMMDMYKTEKVNPLGGCLPVLVQIPVFIALYWVLLESVELRQAGWILWIDDLSTYDPYFVLPLLMGASMFIQQKLNPAPMDPMQQKVMMLLPIVFTVFFLFFPSGLVLYWFVNNTLSIAQQWYITHKMEKDAA